MKKIILTLFAGLLYTALSAQNWNARQVQSPTQFNGLVVLKDTFALDTASVLNVYGTTMKLDTLEDGRRFYKPVSFVESTDTALIRSVVNDSLDALRPTLVTYDSVRAIVNDSLTPIRASIADSARWVVGGSGDAVHLANDIISYSVLIGTRTPVTDANLYINGQVGYSSSNLILSASDTSLDCRNGGVFTVTAGTTPDDTIRNILSAAAGSFIDIMNIGSGNVMISVYALGLNSKVLKCPNGSEIVIPEFGHVRLWAKTADEFWQVSQVTDNQ